MIEAVIWAYIFCFVANVLAHWRLMSNSWVWESSGIHFELVISVLLGEAPSQIVSLQNHDGARQLWKQGVVFSVEVLFCDVCEAWICRIPRSSKWVVRHMCSKNVNWILVTVLVWIIRSKLFSYFSKLWKPLLITINVIGSKPSWHHIVDYLPHSVDCLPLCDICKLARFEECICCR